MELGKLFKNSPCGYALEKLHDKGYCKFCWYVHHQMNVVILKFYFLNFNAMLGFNFMKCAFARLYGARIFEDVVPALGNKNKVVEIPS